MIETFKKISSQDTSMLLGNASEFKVTMIYNDKGTTE